MYILPEMAQMPDYYQTPAGMTPEQQRAYIANSVVNTPNMMGLDPGVSNFWKAQVAQAMLHNGQLQNPSQVMMPIEELYAQRLGAPQMQGEKAPNQFFEWLGGRAGPPPEVTGQKPTQGGNSGGNSGGMYGGSMDGSMSGGSNNEFMDGGNHLASSPGQGGLSMPNWDRAQNNRLDHNYQPPAPAENWNSSPTWQAFSTALGVAAPPLGGLMTAVGGANQAYNEITNPSQPDGVGFNFGTAMDGGRFTHPTYDMSNPAATAAYNKDFANIERAADPANSFASFNGSNDRADTGTIGSRVGNTSIGSSKTANTNTAGAFNFGNINNVGTGQTAVGNTNTGRNKTTSRDAWSDTFWSGGFNNDGYGSASGGNFGTGGGGGVY